MDKKEIALKTASCIRKHSREIAERDMAWFDEQHPGSSLRFLSKPERIEWMQIEIDEIAQCIIDDAPIANAASYIPTPVDIAGAHYLELVTSNLIINSFSFHHSILLSLPQEFLDPHELIEAVSCLDRGTELHLLAILKRLFRKPETLSFDISENAEDPGAFPSEETRRIYGIASSMKRELAKIEQQLDQNGGVMSKIITLNLHAALVELEKTCTNMNRGRMPKDSMRTMEAGDGERHFPVANASLTPREREVLDLVGQGLTNKEIAASLIVSEFTVKNHVSNMLAKLNFTTRSQLAAYSASQLQGRLILGNR